MLANVFAFVGARIAKLSLFQKLLIKIVLIATIPILVISTLFLQQANHIIRVETKVSSERALTQTAARIDNDFAMNKKAISTFASMPEMLSILAANPSSQSVYEQAMDLRKIISNTLSLNLTDSVYRLKLYVNDEFIYARERIYTYPLSEIANEAWYNSLWNYPYAYLPLHRQSYIYLEERDVVSLVTGIQNYGMNNENIGVVMADIDVAQLQKMLGDNDDIGNSMLYIVDAQGDALVCTEGAQTHPLDAEEIRGLIAAHTEDLKITNASMNGWYYQWVPLDFPGWHLLEIIPVRKMDAGIRTLLMQMLLILLITTPFIVSIATATSRSYAKKVNQIAHAVRQYADGETDTRLTVTSSDVVGSLQRDVNHLFDRMNEMMEAQYTLGQQARNADMHALQSQMNPHFLYNTLDMIYWMAKNGESDAVPELVIALSKFYRKSLARGKEIVRIRDELEHIRLYMEIENKRQKNDIEILWDVDEALLDAPIMKLVLQPIVENAVQHGIHQTPDKKGCISIHIWQEGAHMIIGIEDNGAGMSHAQMASLLGGGPQGDENEQGGYGISNVQRRIRLLYGPEYNIQISSELGVGTNITLRIPISLNEKP